MSCPKCETGLMVIETVTTGGFQFEQWRCVNCGKRLTEEEYMGWTEEQRKQHSERMKKNWDQRPRGPKNFKPFTVKIDEGGSVSMQEDTAELQQACTEKPIETAQEYIEAMRSPALVEVDALIADLERQLAETRGVRQLLIQRQGS